MAVSEIKGSKFTCSEQYSNLFNLKCELEFTPNNMIEQTGIIKIQINDGYIATDKCTLNYVTADATAPAVSSYSCSSANDTVKLQLSHTYRLPSGVKYLMTFWGLDTNKMQRSSDYYPNVTIAIRDTADRFDIEKEVITSF